MDTEDEAKSKWCPHARCLGDQASNRPAYGDSDPLCDEYVAEVAAWSPCIGSACMAWREIGERADEKARADRHYKKTGERLTVKHVGYCGLSGRPE